MRPTPPAGGEARLTASEPVPGTIGNAGGAVRAGNSGRPASTARSRAHARHQRMTTYYAVAFLVFLLFPLAQMWSEGGIRRWGGVVLLALFSLVYAGGYLGGWLGVRPFRVFRRIMPVGWLVGLGVLTALTVAVAGPMGLTCLTYIAAGAAATLPTRRGLVVVLLCGVVMTGGGLLLGVDAAWAIGLGLWASGIGLSVWGGVVGERNQDALTREREEKAELAVELERARMARDLHDILGHSLTVITVKAELAGRLVDVDPRRAKTEIADLERLSRDALAEVRETVSGYRQLSLPAELVRARRALDAAGIEARLPGATDDVDPGLRDLFAWVVREGVTNVVRHSGARRCEVELTATTVRVCDDGVGVRDDTAIEAGNGLTGLRERARKVGAVVGVAREPGTPTAGGAGGAGPDQRRFVLSARARESA
ncbi:sensor histidine kinase [Piscicoccus intestinalis]|uniref:sensor histidine kinase n=1 Tax=Piscicoccus intestinalis TaxID=746033 RepID=UPI000AF3A34A|nr:sensor histidine kinase [Piscicoccus intestinalis]